MINFPRINITEKNIVILSFLLLFLLYLCSNLSINIIVSIICIIIFLRYYKDTYNGIKKDLFSKRDIDIYYNSKIETILNDFKEYKKISPYNYNRGITLWKSFIKEIKLLESDDLYNYLHHFENAEFYLKESTNIFMSFSIEAKERKMIDALDYNDFENTKELNRVSKLSKDLYKEGHSILYNLSLRINKRWKENPNIHNKELTIDHPKPRDTRAGNYDYFL